MTLIYPTIPGASAGGYLAILGSHLGRYPIEAARRGYVFSRDGEWTPDTAAIVSLARAGYLTEVCAGVYVLTDVGADRVLHNRDEARPAPGSVGYGPDADYRSRAARRDDRDPDFAEDVVLRLHTGLDPRGREVDPADLERWTGREWVPAEVRA